MFDRDTFSGVIGSVFRLTAPSGQTVDIELTEVTNWKERAGQRSFSALFLVPEGYMVEQGLYDLAHDTLGALQLFLVPVGMDGSRLQLEAVFNYLLEKDPAVSGRDD